RCVASSVSTANVFAPNAWPRSPGCDCLPAQPESLRGWRAKKSTVPCSSRRRKPWSGRDSCDCTSLTASAASATSRLSPRVSDEPETTSSYYCWRPSRQRVTEFSLPLSFPHRSMLSHFSVQLLLLFLAFPTRINCL
ncbi:hypothetical protein PMAYCL1PPCAC_32777, partial [Pristionchus mayeri]